VTFRPKYVPYDEARRLVAERLSLAPDAYNPLFAALEQGDIELEICRKGKWATLGAGEHLSIWRPNPYIQTKPKDGQVLPSDVRIESAKIDKLWPVDENLGSRNPGGRPQKWDWEGALIELARINIIENGDNSRPTLQRLLKEWFALHNEGDCPSDEMVREKVKRFHEGVWPPKT